MVSTIRANSSIHCSDLEKYRQIVFRSNDFKSQYSLFCNFSVSKKGEIFFHSFLLITSPKVCLLPQKCLETAKEFGKKVNIQLIENFVSEKKLPLLLTLVEVFDSNSKLDMLTLSQIFKLLY